MHDFNSSLVDLADRNQRVNMLVFPYTQDFKERRKDRGKNPFQLTAAVSLEKWPEGEKNRVIVNGTMSLNSIYSNS